MEPVGRLTRSITALLPLLRRRADANVSNLSYLRRSFAQYEFFHGQLDDAELSKQIAYRAYQAAPVYGLARVCVCARSANDTAANDKERINQSAPLGIKRTRLADSIWSVFVSLDLNSHELHARR